ncbi:MAG TPA: hypothetical protein VF354_06245 [Candidatus Methanoperedens sp.]
MKEEAKERIEKIRKGEVPEPLAEKNIYHNFFMSAELRGIWIN